MLGIGLCKMLQLLHSAGGLVAWGQKSMLTNQRLSNNPRKNSRLYMFSCHTYVNKNFTDMYTVYISIQLSTTTEKFGSYSGRNLEWVQLQPPMNYLQYLFQLQVLRRFCSKLVELWKFPMFWVSPQILVRTTDWRMLVSKIIPFVNKIISFLMYSFNTCAVLSSICILKNSRSRVPFYIESFNAWKLFGGAKLSISKAKCNKSQLGSRCSWHSWGKCWYSWDGGPLAV